MPTTLFTNIANAIRSRFGISGTITPLQFANKINSFYSVLTINSAFSYDQVMEMILEHTADAIRSKDTTTAKITANDMPSRILDIPTIETKTLTVSGAKWDSCARKEEETNYWTQTFTYTYKVYAKSMNFSVVTVDGETGNGPPLAAATISKPNINTNYTSSVTIKVTYVAIYDFREAMSYEALTREECIGIMDDEKATTMNQASINITLKGTFVNFSSAS